MMDVLINHCWCSDSNWGGHYDCRVIVTIQRIADGNTYYDPPTADWSLTEKVIADGVGYTQRLKPEVLVWLDKNIPNRNDVKGWAVGTDKYNENSALSFPLFFQSYRDAAKFIKRWSSIGKPNDYLNYFKDLRRKYNPTTKTTQKAPR